MSSIRAASPKHFQYRLLRLEDHNMRVIENDGCFRGITNGIQKMDEHYHFRIALRI